MIKFRTARRLLHLLTAATLVAGFAPTAAWAATSNTQDEVKSLLEQYHISKPTDDTLSGTSVDSMINSLHDPYTQYFSPDQLQQFTNAVDQNFVGIGIVMAEDGGAIYLEDVLAGSPAEAAGLIPGDMLVSIDGKSIVNSDVYTVQQAALGAENSIVKVGVKRNGTKLQFAVKRAAIQVPTASSQLMGDGIGYLNLSSFTSDAASKFKAQLQQLEKNGMTSLIIDLRGNGGGYVDQAQQIAALFIADGILAHLKDRDGKETSLNLKGESRSYPVRILVDGGSASASELLSGALQDYKVAKLIGTKTYGKGVMQQLIPLASGGTLKVTVQEYLTPNGHTVDKVGLTPDIAVTGSIPQLMTAFRNAGGQTLKLTTGKGAAIVNGVRQAQSATTIKKDGVWYINTKLGVSVAEAKLGYDAKSKQVLITRNGQTNKLNTQDSHLVVIEGTSYIDVRLLAKWYSDVTWSTAGDGTLTLTDTAA